MIVAGLLSDACVVGMFSIWTLFGKTWRLAIAVTCAYILKAFTSVLF